MLDESAVIKILSFFIVIMALGNGTCVFSQATDNKTFSIYLLPITARNKPLSTRQIRNLVKNKKPLITSYDLASYNKDTHDFQIGSMEATERLYHTKLTGMPFAVFVGKEFIYQGTFLSNIYASIFDGVHILLPDKIRFAPQVSLRLDHPSEKYFTGTDPRSDERILKSLNRAQKLYESLEVTAKCKSIITTTMHVPSLIYKFEIGSIVLGELVDKEIEIELLLGRESTKQLLKLLDADGERLFSRGDRKFDREKVIHLKFDKQIDSTDPHLILRDMY